MEINSPSRWPGFWNFVLVLALALCSGCGTLTSGRGWGQDAIYPVRWERIKQAARHAVCDPVTWSTAAGAAVFAIGDLDNKVSRWAMNETPVFGSRTGAADTSNLLVHGLEAETLFTAVLTPSGDRAADWSLAKLRGLAVEGLAFEASKFLTEETKDLTGRWRPDHSNQNSFPSAHVALAASSARLANRNLDSIQMQPWTRRALQVGNWTAVGFTAWARVEGGNHFPSDVLAGACLGNLVTTFIHDAFMNLPADSNFGFYVEPSPDGAWAMVSWRF